MTHSRRDWFRALGATAAMRAVAGQTVAPSAASASALPDAQKEEIMLKGVILSSEEIGHGVTKPIKIKLRFGAREHYAEVQSVEKELPDFFGEDNKPVPMRDSWKFNIAAYRLDRLLDLRMVPVAIERAYKGKPGALSWWVDDVMFEEVERIKRGLESPDPEDFNRQRELSRVFDELIINIDRNHANLLITKSWKMALIDHSRSFNPYRGIRNRENLTRCGRPLLAKMRAMTTANVSAAMGKYLTTPEVAGVLARRDRIVEFFEKAVREKGEDKVLFG